MNSYTPVKYWSELAENYAQDDRMGLAPVLHPGAPRWFNSRIDDLQNRAWTRAMSICQLGRHASVLDVGCGTGRWVRRWARIGYSPVGVDGSLQMLERAVQLRTLRPLVAGQLQSLPFRDESYDCVSAVTVIQHIPEAEQQRAISELVRVVRPGGYIILMEVIRGQAVHVCSHRPVEWIQRLHACGAELVSWFGQEFLLFDRILAGGVSLSRAVFAGTRTNGLPAPASGPSPHSRFGKSLKRLYWGARWVSVGLSAWIEPLASRSCPQDWATHAAFVFQKPSEKP